MCSCVSQIRYRMTDEDWIAWQRIAAIRLYEQPSRPHWFLWLDWGRAWVVYAAALVGGGYLLALSVAAFLDPRWWNLAFLFGALVAGGLMRQQDDVAGEAHGFSKSLFAHNDVVVRLSDSAISARAGGLALELPWDEILFVHREPQSALVAYDGTGSGILIPGHAFEDEASMDAFIAHIESGREARGNAQTKSSSP